MKTVGKNLENMKTEFSFPEFRTGFVGKSNDITKKYFLNWIFVAELPMKIYSD